MMNHLLQMVGEAHPLHSYLKLLYDIFAGIPVELGKKGFESWQAEKYQHAWLCFSLSITYVAFLVFMALVFTPVFKALIVKKFAASPVIAWGVTAGCKWAVSVVIGKIVTAITRKFLIE